MDDVVASAVATHGSRGSVGCPELSSPQASCTENKAQQKPPQHTFNRVCANNALRFPGHGSPRDRLFGWSCWEMFLGNVPPPGFCNWHLEASSKIRSQNRCPSSPERGCKILRKRKKPGMQEVGGPASCASAGCGRGGREGEGDGGDCGGATCLRGMERGRMVVAGGGANGRPRGGGRVVLAAAEEATAAVAAPPATWAWRPIEKIENISASVDLRVVAPKALIYAQPAPPSWPARLFWLRTWPSTRCGRRPGGCCRRSCIAALLTSLLRPYWSVQ